MLSERKSDHRERTYAENERRTVENQSDGEADQLEISVEGGSLSSQGRVLGIEELLTSLGPFALEGAVFSGESDGQPWELVVAPTEEAGRVALSHSRLEEIDPLVDDLTPDDR